MQSRPDDHTEADRDELWPDEAAELLGVSRQYFNKLLDEGKIPFHLVGTQRQVRRADVLAYEEQMRQRADRALDNLVAQSQRLNPDY